MGRPVILSNGHILVGLDEFGTVHDFYYPYVGMEDLVTARTLNHKIGVWVDGHFSWTDDGTWQIELDFEDKALISNITARNDNLQIELHFQDCVDSHYPAFCRQIEIFNKAVHEREVRLFMHQAFQISKAGRSDTALFVPNGNYLLDYKGWASLLIYGHDADGKPFDQYAIGNCGIEGKEGTFRDAEDGELTDNPVEHGGVDSVMRIVNKISAGGSCLNSYWVIASDSQLDGERIHQAILEKGLSSRIDSTRQSFSDWLSRAQPAIERIDDELHRKMFTKSLLIVKSHIDNHGGIIASCDSSIYNYGRDYYSYVWPRDGAYALVPLIELGYRDEPRKFFQFCVDTMDPAGFMKHKYQSDRALGSTWHPQLHLNHPELPIQEDETAVVLSALVRYYEVTHDEDFVRNMYPIFIKPCADFLTKFVDQATSLPHASYDLWEQKFATFTYTVFTTLSALDAASKVALEFNKTEDHSSWQLAAANISKGLDNLLREDGAYRKSLLLKPDGGIENDDTIDASTFYGALQYTHTNPERLAKTVKLVEEKLLRATPIGGVPRYEHDDYFLADHKQIGNPWMITTLWLAQYYLGHDRRSEALDLIKWVTDRATPSGTLAEQADANTGIGTSVSPLVWSHSTLAHTLLQLYA